MARRRYQKGSIRKRGRRDPVWELLWREDVLREDGQIERRLCSKTLGSVRELTLRQARRQAEEHLRPLNIGALQPQHAITLRRFVETLFHPQCFSLAQALDSEAVQPHFHQSPAPCFRGATPVRHRNPGPAALRVAEDGVPAWAGSRQIICGTSCPRFSQRRRSGQHFTGENPASAVGLPEKKPVRLKHVLSPEQAKRLLLLLCDPARMMVHLALLTGLRVGEILGLRWGDVDFAAGEIR